MKKRKVVDFEKLILDVGKERILEILQKEGSLQEQIAQAEIAQWSSFFNVELTAYILSFAFKHPKEAFVLLQVCKLWYSAFKSKTFWRKYVNLKYAGHLKFIDPFHHLIWPQHRDLMVFGVYTKISELRHKITLDEREIHFSYHDNGDTRVVFGRKVYSNVWSPCCKCTEVLRDASEIYHFAKTRENQILKGELCYYCYRANNTPELTIRGRFQDVDYYFESRKIEKNDPQYQVRGRFDTKEFLFQGDAFCRTDGTGIHVYQGKITDKKTQKTTEFNTTCDGFWETYLLGLRQKEL